MAEAEDTYKPPQKLLVPCAVCGATILRGIAQEGGKIKALKVLTSPVFGEQHVCRKREGAEQG